MPDSLSQSIKQKLNGLTKAELIESLKDLPNYYADTQQQIATLVEDKLLVISPRERFLIEKRIERLEAILEKERINTEILLLAYEQTLKELGMEQELEELSSLKSPSHKYLSSVSSIDLERLEPDWSSHLKLSPRKRLNSVFQRKRIIFSLWSSLKKLLLSEGRFDRLFILTYGGLSIGNALGQLPGAIIGGAIGVVYGLYLTFRHRPVRDVHRVEDERT
jgi:hypothetical protein